MNPPILPDKFARQVKETNKQIILQTFGFISSAFVLVAALAWNETIKTVIGKYFQAGSGIVSLLVYALVPFHFKPDGQNPENDLFLMDTDNFNHRHN